MTDPSFDLESHIVQDPTLVQRMSLRLADILWHRHFELSELAGSVIWTLWALALLNPFASAFAGVPAYRVMAMYLGESGWGIAALLLAANEFCAMLAAKRHWRIVAAGALWAWALLVGSLIGLSNPSGTGVVVYIGVGLLSLFAFLRAFREP